jgi:hypothetical protein
MREESTDAVGVTICRDTVCAWAAGSITPIDVTNAADAPIALRKFFIFNLLGSVLLSRAIHICPTEHWVLEDYRIQNSCMNSVEQTARGALVLN